MNQNGELQLLTGPFKTQIGFFKALSALCQTPWLHLDGTSLSMWT